MRPHHRWIVIYDIYDIKRLNAVAKLMMSFGVRVQRSVFEMAGGSRLVDIVKSKLDSILEDVDSVLFIPLCIDDYEKTLRVGIAAGLEETEIIDNTIFL